MVRVIMTKINHLICLVMSVNVQNVYHKINTANMIVVAATAYPGPCIAIISDLSREIIKRLQTKTKRTLYQIIKIIKPRDN